MMLLGLPLPPPPLSLRMAGQSLPGDVAGSSPPPLSLRTAGQSLPGDVAGRLPESVADPAPRSFRDMCGNRFLVCSPPQTLAGNLWPAGTENSTQTAVEDSLELVECCCCRSPAGSTTPGVDFMTGLQTILQAVQLQGLTS